MNKKKIKKIHEYFLVSPSTLKILLSFKSQTEEKNKIFNILNNNKLDNLHKIHLIHNLLLAKNDNKIKLGKDNDSLTKSNNVAEQSYHSMINDNNKQEFQPNFYSSPLHENIISKDEKNRFLESMIFPKPNEEIFETSAPVFENEMESGNKKYDKDEDEIDISKVKQSFIRRISEAAGREIDDVRDLSVGDVSNDKSYVNVRNKMTNSYYTVEKPEIFQEKKRKKKYDYDSHRIIVPNLRSGRIFKNNDAPIKKPKKKFSSETSFIPLNNNDNNQRRNSAFNTQFSKMANYLLEK